MPPNAETVAASASPALRASRAAAADSKALRKQAALARRQPILPVKGNDLPFTLGTLKRAVPAHCFEPTLRESFGHLARDLVEIAICMALFVYLDSRLSWPLWVPMFLVYTFVQGVNFTGVWVLAHECGHGAFSKSSLVNDAVGYIFHTMLFVPYFSWQRTHANHHHYTNNLQKDEVFVPPKASPETRAQLAAKPSTHRHPVEVVLNLTLMLVFGWPLYLLRNATGHDTNGRPASHFLPSSAIFGPQDYYKVIASTVGLVAWAAAMFMIGEHVGHLLLLKLYLPAYLVNNAFLVAITFLQHTDSRLPHYDDDEWTWLRGALCTVDRSMGSWLDRKLHEIHSLHVCHHVFHKVPFYHAHDATRAMLPILGDYYKKDDTNFLLALYRNFRDCNYLQDTKGIAWWLETHLDD